VREGGVGRRGGKEEGGVKAEEGRVVLLWV